MFLSAFSCNRLSPQEKEIRNNIKKNVNLEMLKIIQKGNTKIYFDDFRNKYKYIYLVYFRNGCMPCYSAYIHWQREMSAINKFDNFTVLFIINGNSYSEFIEEALKWGLERDCFYTFMDPNDTFIDGNEDIPQSIIRRSLLLNDKNQIVLIGSPFSTPEMIKVFEAICSGEEYTP